MSSCVPVSTVYESEQERNHFTFRSTDPFSAYLSGKRSRRAVPIILGEAAILGMKAAKHLRRGAKRLLTDQKHRVYEKSGTFDRAVEDFFSAKPSDHHDFKMPDGVYGKAGTVGDRLLVVRNKGATGEPTLDVIKIEKQEKVGKRKSFYGKLTDAFIYKD